MKRPLKIRKLDLIFLSIISGLLLLIASVYAFNGFKARQSEMAASRSEQAAIQESVAQVQYSQSLAESQLTAARQMRPETDLDLEKIQALDNTDLEFWFTPGQPYQKERVQPLPELQDSLATDSVLWLGEDKPDLFLTMDLGYEYNDNVTKILDIAKEYGVKINFFLTGEFLESEPDKVKRMVAEGHLVGNHTYSHYRAPELVENPDLFKEDIESLANDFKALTGQDIAPYLRPPYGAFSERSVAMNEYLGYYTVFWSFAYLDWDTSDQPDPAWALDNALGQLHNGSILLLHTISDTNVAILPDLFKEAQAQGYTFKRLDERLLP